MKYSLSFLILFLSLPTLQAGDTLKDARTRLLRGNYAEAQEIYAELAKDAKIRPAATIGLSRALEREGSYEEALAVVDKLLKDLPDHADLLARRGEVLYVRGRLGDAEKAAKAALEKNKDNFQAHWVLAQVLRDRGQLTRAEAEFLWFVRTYSKRSADGMEITDPELLQLVGLAAAERARWLHLSKEFKILREDIYGESVKNDKLFWWGEYETGRLYLEKFNKREAEKAFDRALVINPRAAEVIACRGISAMQRLEITEADRYAEQALKINPRLTMALRLKADVFLFGGDLTKALEYLEKARAVNPRDEETLARVAGCWFGTRKKEFDDLVKEVEENNPKAAIFYLELAEFMKGRKLYDDAEKFYLRSIALQPKLPAAQNGLGMLSMMLGKEEQARPLLKKGFKADEFNIRVFNTLAVLDHLDKYTTVKTEHFIIRFDPKNDRVLANFLVKYLEEIYSEYADKFKFSPKVPILIEVFSVHEMFSGRVIALPDLYTVGACTGPVFAMVSPRDRSGVVTRPFNWLRVIRHELVHVFNLEQTRFQVPHWLTEGLAVKLEGTSFPDVKWYTLLPDKMQADELLNLDNIMLGFARPRTPDERSLAYLQSMLYVEYAVKTHGQKAIAGLLEAYAAGLDTEGALKKALGVSKAEFEKGYREFLNEYIKSWGPALARRALTLKQLEDAHARDPNDADAAAQLADRLLKYGKKDQARELADKVLSDKGQHPLAAAVKARILMDMRKDDLAITLLETNIDDKTTEPKALKMLAANQYKEKRYADTIKTLEQGRAGNPGDPTWLDDLASVYSQTKGDEAKRLDVIKEIVKLKSDDLENRLILAKGLLAQGKFADAEIYAREALEIDVLDATAQSILFESLMRQSKDAELRQMKKLLEP